MIHFFLLLLTVLTAHAEVMTVQTDASGTRVYLACEIAGQSQVCDLDTGSSFALVSGPTAFFNAQKILRKDSITGAYGDESKCSEIDIGESYEAAGKSTKIKSLRLCETFTNSHPTIGSSFFDSTKVLLDFQHETLTWNPLVDPNQKLQSFSQDRTRWILFDAIIGKNREKVFFDTGAELTAVDETYIKSHAASFELVGANPVQDSAGKIATEQVYRIKNLSIGGISFEDDFVHAMDFTFIHQSQGPNVVILLGMNHIKKHAWYFDFKKFQWLVLH